MVKYLSYCLCLALWHVVQFDKINVKYMNKIGEIPLKLLYNNSKKVRESYKKDGFNSYEDVSKWLYKLRYAGLPWGTEIPIMGCVFFLLAGTIFYVSGGIFHFKLNKFLFESGIDLWFYFPLIIFSYAVPYKYWVYDKYQKYFEEFDKSEHKTKLFFKGFLLTILFWAYGISGMWFFGSSH